MIISLKASFTLCSFRFFLCSFAYTFMYFPLFLCIFYALLYIFCCLYVVFMHLFFVSGGRISFCDAIIGEFVLLMELLGRRTKVR